MNLVRLLVACAALLLFDAATTHAAEGGASGAAPDRCAALAADAAHWGERGLPWSAYGQVERDTIVTALCERGLQPAPAPDGLPVCAVSTFRQAPFVADEHIPLWLNALHATSRETTLLDLARLPEAPVWSETLRMDLARRMATQGVLAVAVAVPVVSQTCAEGVDLLLVTRDMWSLRFIAHPELDDGRLTRITIGATENNLTGRHLQLAVVAYKDRDFWELGPVLQQRRIGGTMLAGGLSAAAIFTPGLDLSPGFRASASLGRPIETTADRNGWSLSASAQDRRFAIYDGAGVARYDDPTTETVERLKALWKSRSAAANLSITWAFGTDWRQLVTPYLAWSTAAYDLALPAPEELRAAFRRDLLPADERRAGPGLRWTLFEPRYRSLQDFRLFGLAEEVRDGPTIILDGSVSDPLLGATRATQRLSADLSWNGAPLGNDLLRLAAGGALGLGNGLEDAVGWGEIRVVSPAALLGRLHLRAGWVERGRNRSRSYETAGGDEALRGFSPASLRAEGLLRGNLEWRSRPIRSYLARIGGVLFVDAAAPRGDSNLNAPLLSAGLGFRSFLPQLASFVWSADVGFPLLTGGLVAQGNPMLHIRIDQAF